MGNFFVCFPSTECVCIFTKAVPLLLFLCLFYFINTWDNFGRVIHSSGRPWWSRAFPGSFRQAIGAQASPGRPRQALGGQGRPRQAQAGPGKPRTAQVGSGRP